MSDVKIVSKHNQTCKYRSHEEISIVSNGDGDGDDDDEEEDEDGGAMEGKRRSRRGDRDFGASEHYRSTSFWMGGKGWDGKVCSSPLDGEKFPSKHNR